MNYEKRLRKDLKHNKFMAIASTIQTVLLVIILILILINPCACCTGLFNDCTCHTGQEQPTKPNKPWFDPSQDSDIDWGERPTRPQSEIQEELNRQVEEGMMNISMNTNPVFADGKAKGNLLIVNEEFNRYAQVIQIYRDDTGELIYTSGAIPVGARLDEDALDVDLDMGVYECTAHFNQIDAEGNLLGKACAKIKIYVQG